jgi:hypothetical protein
VKVTFTYTPLLGGAAKAEVLALGQRNSPIAPMEFAHAGAVQTAHAIRAETLSFFARGGGNVTESFQAQKEHNSYWEAVTWTRIEVGKMRGKSGTLLFEADTSGRIRLLNAICTAASGRIMGIVSFVDFTFVGGLWQPA